MQTNKSQRFRLDEFRSDLTFWNKLERLLWNATWLVLCRFTPVQLHRWRCFVLQRFGANIGHAVRFYPSVDVFLPRNLTIGDHCVIGPRVRLYSVAPIILEEHVMISQDADLCTGTHDHTDERLPLVAKPIRVQSHTWVCARAFLGPGVTVGSDAVVGACAVVFRDVPSGHIVGGNPAKLIRSRDVAEENESG